MKQRFVPESNYRSIYLNTGRTIRIPLDTKLPITELQYPEFLDIKITNWCDAGCHHCYQNSTRKETHYSNVTDKLRKFFDSIPEGQLPYQIAYGGGEPTAHPEFIEILELTKEYGISPNFTTNGTNVVNWSCNKLEKVASLVGGVAVSMHGHLKEIPLKAVRILNAFNIPTNTHHIISNAVSIDKFVSLCEVLDPYIEYFVLLPYTNTGRAAKNPRDLDWEYFVEKFPFEYRSKIAFGANFYPYLQRRDLDISVSLYEPEILSKYVDLADNGYMYSSSFSDVVLKKDFL